MYFYKGYRVQRVVKSVAKILAMLTLFYYVIGMIFLKKEIDLNLTFTLSNKAKSNFFNNGVHPGQNVVQSVFKIHRITLVVTF